jgi:subtilisin family serine protease
MNLRLFFFCLMLLFVGMVSASTDMMRLRVLLKDKNGASVESARDGLSVAALERRSKQGLVLDSFDIPVYPGYMQAIENKGLPVVSLSKWMNSVVVSASDSSDIDTLLTLPFVRSVQLVWMKPVVLSSAPSKAKTKRVSKFSNDTTTYYGNAKRQLEMLGLDPLHEAGFKGKGKLIAVIDAGFLGVDTMQWFQHVTLTASRDFIYPPSDLFAGHYHGTAVLSLMAINEPYLLVGSAPEASYCLLRSEDVNSEFPIEEDYWAAAAEFADSIGADIITSSLGYTEFDMPALSYKRTQLDGKTAFVTRVASIAASKGILVVASAGNDGNNAWKKISFPADASEVLAIGAVQSDLTRSSFSSVGPTVDGRIKPDVMGMGTNDAIINGSGKLTVGNGTSFSAPLVSGMAASIWSALPNLKASDLRDLIRESGSQYLSPDSLYGYGVPNAQKIWIAEKVLIPQVDLPSYYCYPNPVRDQLYLADLSNTNKSVRIVVYNVFGRLVMEKTLNGNSSSFNVNNLPSSIYLVDFWVDGVRKASQKIRKQP